MHENLFVFNFLLTTRPSSCAVAGGPDAAIERIYQIDLGRLEDVVDGTTITKTLFRDIMPDLAVPNGNIYEKIEGMAVTSSGEVYINNDNDGVDDNSGEQQLINLGVLVMEVPTLAPTAEEDDATASPTDGGDDSTTEAPAPASGAYASFSVTYGVLVMMVGAYVW